ncbi:MAG: Arm DNA-binding domain-containing protein, partial [Acidobacteriaceae bacterium]
MKYELTEKLIKKLQPPAKGNRIVFGDIPCFGVRVTAAGAIAFIYNYRFQGVPRRHTIGSYPAWTLMQARDEALRLRKLVESGIDPLQERQDQREAPTVKEL